MDLGLPDLSAGALGGGAGSAGKLNPVSLLAGSHSWRVWFVDPTHARLALVDGTDEYDVVRNGSDVWQWSSADASVAHGKVPAGAANPGDARPPALPGSGAAGIPDLSNPDAVATWALSQLDPTTAVTSTRTDRVARRSAYGLVLTPRAPDTRIGSVHLSLDAETSLPLAATVFPRGSTRPAVDVRFTTLTLARPAPSIFEFTPPPGATVTIEGRHDGPMPKTDRTPFARPHVVGTGWSSVVVGELPAMSTASTSHGAASDPMAVLRKVLPRASGAWGSGHVLTTRLFSVVVTDDGRFAAGAVDPSVLYAALAH
ncbi:LolA family protein [Knoellia sp. CPCC 206450]|uniref:LolA family protein n=1 Tax=Knoellia tibetensis TaxID=3404798 RepID=UPI003B439C1C